MSSKSIKSLILVLAFSIPATLGAQDNAGTVTGALAGQGTGQATAGGANARIDAVLQTALEAGIPVSLLESKIAEGRAKGVPMERIAAAIEGRLAALMHAAETMSSAGVGFRSAGELSVAVDALEAGVGEDALVRVSSSAPAERRVVAVAVLTGLVRLGNGAENALARVNAALGTNTALANLSATVASDAALANLQAEVASQLQVRGLGSTLDVLGPTGVGAGANANAAGGIGIGNGPGASAGADASTAAGVGVTPPDLPDISQPPAGALQGGLGATGTLGLD